MINSTFANDIPEKLPFENKILISLIRDFSPKKLVFFFVVTLKPVSAFLPYGYAIAIIFKIVLYYLKMLKTIFPGV